MNSFTKETNCPLCSKELVFSDKKREYCCPTLSDYPESNLKDMLYYHFYCVKDYYKNLIFIFQVNDIVGHIVLGTNRICLRRPNYIYLELPLDNSISLKDNVFNFLKKFEIYGVFS